MGEANLTGESHGGSGRPAESRPADDEGVLPISAVDLDEVRRVARSRPIFVCGNVRSGTTVLGLALSAHPAIDIVYETGLMVDLPLRPGPLPTTPEGLYDLFASHLALSLIHPELDEVRTLLLEEGLTDFAETARFLFALHAVRRGKRRYGDKLPKYIFHIRETAALFPDGLFIHVVRDGRDSAASVHDIELLDPGSVEAAAYLWRRAVRAGREAGRSLPKGSYTEVRLEDFVSSTEAVMRRLCDFVGEEFDPATLNYYERRADSLRHHREHQHTAKPPTEGLRNWAKGLSPSSARSVETLLAGTLFEFGYGRPESTGAVSDLWYLARAYLVVGAALPKNLASISHHLRRRVVARTGGSQHGPSAGGR